MERLRFDAATLEAAEVRLRGPAAAGRVQALGAGGWRIVAGRPGAVHGRRSWVVERPAARRVALAEGEAAWSVVAGGDRLLVGRGDFEIRWLDRVRFEVRAGPDGSRLRLDGARGRRLYGLGERTGGLDRRGRRWVNWNTDAWGYRPGDDPLYQSHPFVLALDPAGAWGLYVDEPRRTVFDLGADGSMTVDSPGPALDILLVPGPAPADVVERYTALVGRPPLPPLWALGYHQSRWGYRDAGTVRAVVRAHRARDIPLDAVWLDIDHLDGYRVFSFCPRRFPAPERLIGDLRRAGARAVVIVDPAVKREPGWRIYDEGRARDAYVRHRGAPFVGRLWPGPVVWPDFAREDVRAWWGDLHAGYVRAGVAGFWNDMNEPVTHDADGNPRDLPLDADHHGHPHAEIHNLYGSLMSRATHDALRRRAPDRHPFVLTRAGFAGVQRHAWVWTGDTTSDWAHLAQSVPMLLGLGLSGVPFAGADVGGFAGDADGELLARWSWLGAFYPFMRNHSARDTHPQEAWAFGEPWTRAVRAAVRFRYRLLPYLYTLAHEATARGFPPLRPLFFDRPADPSLADRADAFLLGPALLVAPVLEPGRTTRRVPLPPGRWQDFWTGAWHEGPDEITAAAPIDSAPLYQRAGTALPLTDPAPHTTTARWRPLVWRIAPAGTVAGIVYEDDGDGFAPGTHADLVGHPTPTGLELAFRDPTGPPDRAFVEVLRPVPGAPPARLLRPLPADAPFRLPW